MKTTHHVISEEGLTALQKRNQERAADIIKQMGRKYVCHPANVLGKAAARGRFVPAEPVIPPRGVLLKIGGVK